MVVLDKMEYLEKAEALLVQTAYRTIDKDPTNDLKARLIQTFRGSKGVPAWVKVCIGPCTLLVIQPQSSPQANCI